MFQNETSNKFSREVPLERVTLQLNMEDERDHYFEIRTEQTVYLCGCKRTRSRVSALRSRRDEKSNVVFSFVRRNTIWFIRTSTRATRTRRFVRRCWGPCKYYVIKSKGGGGCRMITSIVTVHCKTCNIDYQRGEGVKNGPKTDDVILAWPLGVQHRRQRDAKCFHHRFVALASARH